MLRRIFLALLRSCVCNLRSLLLRPQLRPLTQDFYISFFYIHFYIIFYFISVFLRTSSSKMDSAF
uniref:Uncharacterized protein n=1 Tax=Anguilla anguilla TaxID=7936 RepID=A0A0E9PDG8_ANGAN